MQMEVQTAGCRFEVQATVLAGANHTTGPRMRETLRRTITTKMRVHVSALVSLSDTVSLVAGDRLASSDGCTFVRANGQFAAMKGSNRLPPKRYSSFCTHSTHEH